MGIPADDNRFVFAVTGAGIEETVAVPWHLIHLNIGFFVM